MPAIAVLLLLAGGCGSSPPSPPPIVQPATPELYDPLPASSTYVRPPVRERGTLGAVSGRKSVWYHFNVAPGGTLRIDLNSENRTSSSAWQLFDDSPAYGRYPSGELASGRSYTAARLFLTETDAYYVRVSVADDVRQADYILSVDYTPPALQPAPQPRPKPKPKEPKSGRGTRRDDKRNDAPQPAPKSDPVEASRSDATPLDTSTSLRLGRGASHSSRWYRIRAPYRTSATITFKPDSASRAPVSLELHAATRMLKKIGPSRERLQITTELVAGGTFFVRIGAGKGSQASGALSVRYEHFLEEPGVDSAASLAPGATMTSVGGDSGVRWRWYSFRLRAESIVKMSLRSSGDNAVATVYRDGLANVVRTLTVDPSAELCALLPPGAYLVRVEGREAGRASVRMSVTINERSASAGFTDVTSKPCP